MDQCSQVNGFMVSYAEFPPPKNPKQTQPEESVCTCMHAYLHTHIHSIHSNLFSLVLAFSRVLSV